MKKTIIIEGNANDMKKLEMALALVNLTLVTDSVATPKATPKKEYAMPYVVDGTKVTIKSTDGAYMPSKVFNAVKFCIKQNGGTWDKTAKVWKFKSKKAVGEFEKAWKDGKK